MMTFEEAVHKITYLPKKPETNIILQLYGLYKQATQGNITSEGPSGFDFKAMAKHDAWSAQRGKSPEEAKKEYIRIVESLEEDT